MGHKAYVDKFRCKGCGSCEEVAPRAFKMDESCEKAEFIDKEDICKEDLEKAAIICPTNCIELEIDKDT